MSRAARRHIGGCHAPYQASGEHRAHIGYRASRQRQPWAAGAHEPTAAALVELRGRTYTESSKAKVVVDKRCARKCHMPALLYLHHRTDSDFRVRDHQFVAHVTTLHAAPRRHPKVARPRAPDRLVGFEEGGGGIAQTPCEDFERVASSAMPVSQAKAHFQVALRGARAGEEQILLQAELLQTSGDAPRLRACAASLLVARGRAGSLRRK